MADNAPESGDDKELSMEEILQSIRKIIAEDGDEAKDPAAKSPIGIEEDVPGSDVLELTEMLKDDGTVVSLKPAAEPAPVDVLSSIDEALTPEKPPEKPAEKPIAPPPAPVQAAVQSMPSLEESLLSDAAASAASAALKRLRTPESPPIAHAPTSESFRSGTTIEDLVSEMLKPMMKVWLDTHLPEIVERIVEKEVRKLSNK